MPVNALPPFEVPINALLLFEHVDEDKEEDEAPVYDVHHTVFMYHPDGAGTILDP